MKIYYKYNYIYIPICEYGSNLGTQIWDGLLFDMDQNLLSLSSKSINGGWHESEQIDSTNPLAIHREVHWPISSMVLEYLSTPSESASLPVILVPYNNPYMGYLNLGRLPGFTCAKNKPCCSLAWCPHHALHHPKGAEVTRTLSHSGSLSLHQLVEPWAVQLEFMGFSWDWNGIFLGLKWDFLGMLIHGIFLGFYWNSNGTFSRDFSWLFSWHFSDLRSASPAPLAHPILGENSSPYYHLVMTNIAMGFRWPIEIDGLPNLKMVIFHGYVK